MKVKKILSNEYIFSIITKILSVAIGLLYSAFFARFVGPTLKGEITYILSIVTVGSVVMTVGMHHAFPYYRKKSENVEEYISKFTTTVFVYYFVIVFLAAITSAVITVFFKSNYLVITIWLMILWSYNRVLGYVVLVEEPNKKNKMVLLFTFLEAVLTVFLFFSTQPSFLFGILCSAFCQILECVYYSFSLKKRIQLSLFSPKHLFEVMILGVLPMLALLMNTLNYRIDIFMLEGASNITYAEIGIYSIGVALAEKVLLIPDAMQEILLSKLAKEKGADEVALICRITFPICLFVAVCIGIVGKPFLLFLFGPEYSGAYLVTLISISGTALMVFYKMVSQYNIICHKQWKNIVFLLVGIVVNVILNFVFVPLFGINGAAIATCIGYFVCSVLFIISFSNSTSIKWNNVVFISREDIKTIKNIIKK